MSNADALTPEEHQELVRLLGKIEPGFLPFDIFLQVARLIIVSILEIVPLRLHDGQVEILLLQREPDDPIWPNKWHSPGTVLRINDIQNFQPAINRILVDELQGTEVSDLHFVGNILHTQERGPEQAQVYWVEVLGEPKAGKFYPVDQLPENFIESQQKFIKQAVESFKSQR